MALADVAKRGAVIAVGLAGLVAAGCSGSPQDDGEPPARRPNILLIVADDLGYSDIGAFGGEIETPNLDELARSGVRLTNFHTAPACSPTRAMLLTGVDNHIAGLGSMAETLTESQRGRPGYEGHLNDRVVSVARLLRDAGYRTYVAGKWHLGREPGQLPPDHGFDRSFVLLQGGAGHFDATGPLPGDPVALYREDGREVQRPEGVYSSDLYTDRMLTYLDEALAAKEPFFAYVAYTAPHWPIQAPDELIRKYERMYQAGYEAIRAARLQRQVRLGLIDDAGLAAPAPAGVPQWADLSAEERVIEARKMAVYAGMVDNLDHNVGRLLHRLRSAGAYENTLIVFMSDNGAEGAQLMAFPAFREWAARHFDNSLENLGRRGSYVTYGPAWAHVSNTPFRGAKGSTYEGGTRVPAVIVAPDSSASRRVDAFTTVLDIVPTILDVANVPLPSAIFRGRDIEVPGGRSLRPWLLADADSSAPAHRPHGVELFGNRALYDGRWKAVYVVPPWGPGRWELFDLEADPGERRDLAAQRPRELQALVTAYASYAERNGVVALGPQFDLLKQFDETVSNPAD